MNKLFLKLGGILLAMLLVVGAAYLTISSCISEDYIAEVNQQLYGGIADHTVQEVKPLVNGAVDTILNSSERLGGLISQLFEYSKLEAHQIEPQKEAFSVGELAQDVAHKFSVLAATKDIAIKLERPDDLPRIFADLGLVERVLQNLMDNALKFTPADGTVTIRMQSDRHNVRISVADTGPGIPEAELPFIFDRYRKGSRTNDGRNGGAGLGLAIVKKVLELHDQSIEIKSRVKEGTSFIFELPRPVVVGV